MLQGDDDKTRLLALTMLADVVTMLEAAALMPTLRSQFRELAGSDKGPVGAAALRTVELTDWGQLKEMVQSLRDGAFATAERQADVIVREEPRGETSLLVRAEARRGQGNMAGALEAYAALLAQDPTSAWYLTVMGIFSPTQEDTATPAAEVLADCLTQADCAAMLTPSVDTYFRNLGL